MKRLLFSGFSGALFGALIMAVFGLIAYLTAPMFLGLVFITAGTIATIKIAGLIGGLVVAVINFFGFPFLTRRSVVEVDE